MIIPMDAPTPPTAPLEPVTRARAKAIEDMVNSLLSKLPLSLHEKWLLPKFEMLCMIRYQEDPPEDAREGVQAPSSWMKRTHGRSQEHLPGPGHPAPGASSTTAAQPPSAYRPRKFGPASPDIRPLPSSRISGLQHGNPDPSEPESNKAHRSSPDIRHRVKAWTSGPTP